jgi:hypothetical protein
MKALRKYSSLESLATSFNIVGWFTLLFGIIGAGAVLVFSGGNLSFAVVVSAVATAGSAILSWMFFQLVAELIKLVINMAYDAQKAADSAEEAASYIRRANAPPVPEMPRDLEGAIPQHQFRR